MKLLIIIFAFCLHYVFSTKNSQNILRSEILEENFKDFGKFAQSLFRDDVEGNEVFKIKINIQLLQIRQIMQKILPYYRKIVKK